MFAFTAQAQESLTYSVTFFWTETTGKDCDQKQDSTRGAKTNFFSGSMPLQIVRPIRRGNYVWEEPE